MAYRNDPGMPLMADEAMDRVRHGLPIEICDPPGVTWLRTHFADDQPRRMYRIPAVQPERIELTTVVSNQMISVDVSGTSPFKSVANFHVPTGRYRLVLERID